MNCVICGGLYCASREIKERLRVWEFEDNIEITCKCKDPIVV